MGKTTGIEWTDATWNPWYGCHKVSQGCKNCFMFREQKQYGRDPNIVQRSKTRFDDPLKWEKEMTATGAPPEGETRRIFTCSWSDFFIEEADPWRAEAWEIIRKTPHLTYQILTKRPENIGTRLPDGILPRNVWLGVSAEDQANVDARIPLLLRTSAAVHFVSAEPLLGALDMREYLTCEWFLGPEIERRRGTFLPDPNMPKPRAARLRPGLDWVIVGGESGPHARPMHPLWARSLRAQCTQAGVKFFFKQWGEWALKGSVDGSSSDFGVLAPTGEWYHQHTGWNGRPVAPDTGEAYMVKVGKKRAGNLLDGLEWKEFPETEKIP